MNQQKLNELAMQSGGIWRGGHVEQLNGDSVWTEQKWVDPCDMDLNKFAELIVKDVFAMIKESCVDADVMDRVDEVIDDRLNDAASDVVDAYGITDRIY